MYLSVQNDLLAKVYLCFLFFWRLSKYLNCAVKRAILVNRGLLLYSNNVVMLEFICMTLAHQIMIKLYITLYLGLTKLGWISLILVFFELNWLNSNWFLHAEVHPLPSCQLGLKLCFGIVGVRSTQLSNSTKCIYWQK